MSDTPTSGEFAEQFGEKPVMRSEVDATRIGQLEKELADTKRELEMVKVPEISEAGQELADRVCQVFLNAISSMNAIIGK